MQLPGVLAKSWKTTTLTVFCSHAVPVFAPRLRSLPAAAARLGWVRPSALTYSRVLGSLLPDSITPIKVQLVPCSYVYTLLLFLVIIVAHAQEQQWRHRQL